MSFRFLNPLSFGRGFSVANALDSYSSPGPGTYNPKPIMKKPKNNDWMFRTKSSFRRNKNENIDIRKHTQKNVGLKGENNIQPSDFYNVQEKYVNESKKPKIPIYSFGKAKRLEYKEKKKNNNNNIVTLNQKKQFKKNFEEEKNKIGDNCPNNIKFEEEKNIQGDKSQNINNKKYQKKDSEENDIPGVDKYNIRGSLTVPVVKFGTEKKGLNYGNIISPGPAKYNLREKEFGKINTKYSIPKGPRGIEQRPFTPGPGKYNPSQNLTKKSIEKYSFPKDRRMHYFTNSNPGPGNYYKESKIFGADGKKVSFLSGRKDKKYNYYPGPNKYNPNFKILKKKYPSYRIGTAKRRKLYDIDETFPGPNKYKINDRYNSKRPKSSAWKIGTEKRPPLFLDTKTPGVGMYSLRNNKNNAPKYTLREKFDIKSKEKRPGVGQYNISKSINFMMKKEPGWKIGKASRDDMLTKDKRGNPGPGMYRIPCSIVDVNDYTREKGKFDKNFIYV